MQIHFLPSAHFRFACLFALIAAVGPFGTRSLAQESVLYNFADTTGNGPEAGVILDKNGNLYGTTPIGGNLSVCNSGCGVVYEIVHNSDGTWTNSTLYEFAGGTADGASPLSALVFDSRGHLFGTTIYGGTGSCNQGAAPGCGTVFELVRNSTGGGWTEKMIYSFQGGSDGAYPAASLTFDSQGNVYGTTTVGGMNLHPCGQFNLPPGCGTVFELSPNSDGSWSESVLYSFKGDLDGALAAVIPSNGLILDGAGNLFGTTSGGGSAPCEQLTGIECGTIFRLHRTSTGWVKYTLYRFQGGTDGFRPKGNLALDAAGNLYGTTYYGGTTNPAHGNGTVYELTPGASGGWSETVIYRFTGLLDGANPEAGVTFDAGGNMYGLAGGGGTTSLDTGGGTVFELSPSSSEWTETTLATFQSQAGGEFPYGGVALNSSGNLFGTLWGGGAVTTLCPSGCGVVFEVTP